MISFWTLFTSHNSEKYENVLRKNSKDGFAEKYSLQCIFVFLLVCIVLFYLKRLLSDSRRCLVKPIVIRTLSKFLKKFVDSLLFIIMNFAADYGLTTRLRGVLTNTAFH